MSLQVEIASSISDIDPASWDALTDGSPLLSHAFLSALEKTGCVGPGTGWQACPLLVKDQSRLLGAMPLYAKSHSYGEYVFDWAWANAFEQHGLDYYPKLICAIPFTPITGPRICAPDPAIRKLMVEVLSQQLHSLKLSSAHVLFPDDESAESLEKAGWLRRSGVQFRWENENFPAFEAFLATLSHDKRKKIRQERKKIAASGIQIRRLTGNDISGEDRQYRSSPYLTKAFFLELAQHMSRHVLLIVAERAGEKVAAALNLYGDDRQGVSQLYGRYWGALEHVPGLHFELCYYQAQEFCIERGIRYFEGGAQGEHKLARGFRPRPTCSFHRIAHPVFASSIAQVLEREAGMMELYQSELEERAPFRRNQF